MKKVICLAIGTPYLYLFEFVKLGQVGDRS